ncbi:hypothetical protein M441DRAFT_352006 [Trichoderma asperellum CBS 433.97]|uniref:Uncharacterized protein n=1 Tax=Trichoderma asperellum (strain ATCC 204424 / CBS 433.97 / NBRC 101777) TaxID=1042311 RepID=A0A2T3ZIG0_TRIA4|nr:hypothetical protein M441DRAFT_352006 [Trichoderma asperellum CBS 433.97]PTB44598.1 hypothetical protein M441DRAFT_352006 [Trichoderma asperellum CBS 433.97]
MLALLHPPLRALGSAVIQRWLQALPAGSIKSQLEELLFWNLESTLFFFPFSLQISTAVSSPFRFSILDYCMCWQRCAPPVFFASSRFFHGGESSCKRGRRSRDRPVIPLLCFDIERWHSPKWVLIKTRPKCPACTSHLHLQSGQTPTRSFTLQSGQDLASIKSHLSPLDLHLSTSVRPPYCMPRKKKKAYSTHTQHHPFLGKIQISSNLKTEKQEEEKKLTTLLACLNWT